MVEAGADVVSSARRDLFDDFVLPGPLLDGSVQPLATLPTLVKTSLVALFNASVPNAARDVRRAAIDAIRDAHADPDFPSCLLANPADDAAADRP